MRVIVFLIPAILMAQTPAAKAPAAAPAPAKSAAKSPAKSTAAKSATAKAKSAAPAAAPGTLTTDDQKMVYAIGLSIAKNLSSLDLSHAEMEIVKRALDDAAAGKPALDVNEYSSKINSFAQSRSAAKEKAKGKAYAAKAAIEPGATQTPSGLVYRTLAEGTGASPQATDKVKVNYRGTLVDGTEFDSSYKRNQPAEFPLNGVIPCWTEGVQRMKVGGKSQLVCPSGIAYGDGGRPSIPGGATLIFEIELLGIN